ncbi:MAG: hypothetical protein IPM47_21085 [Sphingobacteriales bacterium]|nr:MAG: hypothetical protein IPM47_21085 [Sphingobacteriales bacterium]
MPIDETTVQELCVVARCRWKIENEPLNTLKNQGYNLEHNYVHGQMYLPTNFMLLTFFSFLVNQIAQHLDQDFQAAKKAAKTLKALWEKVRALVYFVPITSIGAVYRFIGKAEQLKVPRLNRIIVNYP